MHGGHGGPGFMGLIGALFLLLLIAALIKLLVKGQVGPVRWKGHKGSFKGGSFQGFTTPGHSPTDAAFETLRMRLANGDISPDEYMERSSALRSVVPPNDPKEKP